jgi:hypothetical protein
MNPTRKTKVEDLEAALQARIRQQDLVPAERFREKLTDLRTFIHQLARTDEGKADLQRRIDRFGDCRPLPEESDRYFYGKLRRWLDHDLQERNGRRADRDPMAGLT